MQKIGLLRRFSQGTFLIVFFYILWSTTYPLKGLLRPEDIFRLDPLVVVFTSLSERILIPGMLFSLFMLLGTFILGRFFCGWVCPLGTLLDMLGMLRKNRPRQDGLTGKGLGAIKFYILGCIAVGALVGFQLAWLFDPLVIMARFVSLNLIPALTLAIDTLFITTLRRFSLYGPLYDFYHALKSSLLGINIYYFAHSTVIGMFFLAILGLVFVKKRFWCRCLCPLGALYALPAKVSLLRRTVEDCLDCSPCRTDCPMGAIRDDLGYAQEECILCMDCVRNCPQRGTRFIWLFGKKDEKRKSTLPPSA